MNSWLLAALALVIGTIIGLVASRIVYSFVGSPRQSEAVRSAAKPLARLVFAVGLVGGLVGALGFVQPSALEQLPKDAVAFIPKVLMAAIIIIVANVLASFATAAIDRATARMPIQVQRQANLVVKATIITLAVLLAVSQLGVDTEVVNMGVAAVFFGIAASLTLLVGLGGQAVAREVASSRALRRLFQEGDMVEIDGIRGRVQGLYPTAVEISTVDEESMLVPSSRFLSETVTVTRSPASEGATKTEP